MNIKNKIVLALGGVTGEKYKMMKTLYECEKSENRRLRAQLDSMIEVVSTVKVNTIMMGGKEKEVDFVDYIKNQLAAGLASGMKEHMTITKGKMNVYGEVNYTASVFVIGKEEQDDG